MWPGFLLCSQAQHWDRSLIARVLALLVSLRLFVALFLHSDHLWFRYSEKNLKITSNKIGRFKEIYLKFTDIKIQEVHISLY